MSVAASVTEIARGATVAEEAPAMSESRRAFLSTTPQPDLAGAFRILAEGTDESELQLFSRWEPSGQLRERLGEISLTWHPLEDIPHEDAAPNVSDC